MAAQDRLEARIAFEDGELLAIEVSFERGGFSGRASAYTVRADLEAFARDLARFSGELRAGCAFEAGLEGGDSPLGFVALRFYGLDALGHVACHLRLKTEAAQGHRPEELTRVAIELRTEPGLLDGFVAGVERLLAGGGPAVLPLTDRA
jgi:hypothetical protein